MYRFAPYLKSLCSSAWMPLFLCAALCTTVPVQAAEELFGRYRIRDTRIDYTITIPQQRPAAAIIIQYLPPHTEVLSSQPPCNSYDPESGEMKWLFTDPSPGDLRIGLELAAPISSREVRAEVLFKDHTGESHSHSGKPLPLMRKMLEGC